MESVWSVLAILPAVNYLVPTIMAIALVMLFAGKRVSSHNEIDPLAGREICP